MQITTTRWAGECGRLWLVFQIEFPLSSTRRCEQLDFRVLPLQGGEELFTECRQALSFLPSISLLLHVWGKEARREERQRNQHLMQMQERTLLDSPFEWRAAIVSEAPLKPGSTPRAREVFLKNLWIRVFFTKLSLCCSRGSLLSGLPCQTALEQCTELRDSRGGRELAITGYYCVLDTFSWRRKTVRK